MWKTNFLELGRIKEKSKNLVFFEYNLPLPEGFKIISMRSSCGCSVPNEEPDGISVEYKSADVPPQLEAQGEYTAVKKITVETNQGDFILEFRATVYK